MSAGARTRSRGSASGRAAANSRRGIRFQVTGFRQQPVVDVDFGAPLPMTERRNFVHPDAVVTVVVRVDLRLEPAALDQPFLDLTDPFFRHQQIDIGEDPAARWRKLGQEIGAALEQDQRHVDPLERPKQAVHLPGNQGIAVRDDVAGCSQMGGGTRRDVSKQTGTCKVGLQSSEHSGAPGHAQEQFPVGWRQARQFFGCLQCREQQSLRPPGFVGRLSHRRPVTTRRAH